MQLPKQQNSSTSPDSFVPRIKSDFGMVHPYDNNLNFKEKKHPESDWSVFRAVKKYF